MPDPRALVSRSRSPVRAARFAGWLLGALLATAGCATVPPNPPLGQWKPEQREPLGASGRREDTLVLLAFSGGGTRAAAFAYGVLEELRDTVVPIGGQPRRLLDEVDVVSGVSGGSFPAAYYALHGDGIFEDFGPRFLDRNVQRDLLLALLNPVNWVRLSSPFFGRSDIAAEYYDREIFDGATFADLVQGPHVSLVINATDMVRGSRFSFLQPELDFLCADLAPIPLSRAVAASSAVPGIFTPITLRSYAGTCGFEPPAWIAEAFAHREDSRRRLRQAEILSSYLDPSQQYVYLLDGGISDNLGIRFSFERTVREGDFQQVLEQSGLVNVRQILMIVVNAETQPELFPTERGLIPTGLLTLIHTVTGIQTRSTNFETIELMRSSFQYWARGLAEKSGHPVNFQLVDLYFDAMPDPAERAYLRNLPTSLALGRDAVDRLRAAGRKLLRGSPQLQEAIAHMSELPPRSSAGTAPPAPRER